ncbi:MAG: hypothetical protein QW597_00685 [Thermoplasmataceae archaeon]
MIFTVNDRTMVESTGTYLSSFIGGFTKSTPFHLGGANTSKHSVKDRRDVCEFSSISDRNDKMYWNSTSFIVYILIKISILFPTDTVLLTISTITAVGHPLAISNGRQEVQKKDYPYQLGVRIYK